jgi:chromosome segregation ATPase
VIADIAQALKADAGSAAMVERLHAAEHRAIRAEHERAVAKVEAEKLRDELTRLRTEADGLREQVRALSRNLREAQTQERRTSDLLAHGEGPGCPARRRRRGRTAPGAREVARR